MVNLKSITYREGEKISCPHCKSIQIKSMVNQPKKYPEPKTYWHSNKKEVEALKKVWDHGYDCKKCGNEFIAFPWTMTQSWETSTPKQHTKEPKNKSGFFSKLIKLFVLLIIAFLALSFFLVDDESLAKSNTKSQDRESTTSNSDSIANSQNINDTLSIKTTIRESK